LLDAVDAGLNAGGEVRSLRSAGFLVADTQRWPIVDLRVDEHDKPLTELRRLWTLYEPLLDGYVSRTTDPHLAVIAPASAVNAGKGGLSATPPPA
jgi:uncharacterized Ntn-hydrolase superfamily protein